ncbi:MAG: cysteine--tRNA ligase [Bacteroidales bacterium]|jgi:cysteinyl-tRNA synthetase|nr:cysteine--tRNA ligase [Bacteroidales bacterium]
MSLKIYNTLSRKKEDFQPINPPFVGLYVCGPTVYGDAHLGHARPGITFDVLYRFLKFSEYKVRYVRNITDVGHLENDADEGEDKIAKKARLEELEPMEVVFYYMRRYHKNMDQLNVLRPDIEPQASAHILEQIEMVQQILDSGYAYESDGSVYFDVKKYAKDYDYGKLSGRKIDDLLSTTRVLDGQSEKRNSADFALWKKAAPSHIMRWNSPWGEGFPGWHMECSVMSTKYLGETFDIHGGGIDLLFPHHECEIAQSTAAQGKESVKYWIHNNLITINGQKMGKSLGNFITLDELFAGTHKALEQAYHPMTVRFFILQAHYRGTLDFSNEALQAAEKGFKRLMRAYQQIDKLQASDQSSISVEGIRKKCMDALNDDLNTPILISHLFDAVKLIGNIETGSESINETDKSALKKLFQDFAIEILGLIPEEEAAGESSGDRLKSVVDLLLDVRLNSKNNKDWATSDLIRDKLKEAGIIVRDKKDGYDWELE